jgi:Ser/Thr protein kinase RdoA (MazF antagonist)
LRSDNLIFRDGHDPMLVDWPFLSYGSVLMDVAFFLPSVAGEGGPPPHAGLAQYEQESGMSFDEHHVRATAAAVAGFFAARAGQPAIPGLPRLRWVQAMQLFPCLDWLRRLLEIDPPPSPSPKI